MAVFVLVHGGWQGGWSYQRLARLLRKAGHEVYTPTLTGLGERSHLAHAPINLDTHIADVENLIVWEDLGDVTLVGHSYGGMVVTGVADRIPERIARLVYLDATIPQDGQTLLGLRPEYRDMMLQLAAAAEGRFVPPPQASEFDARPEFWPLLDARNVPHPLACFTQAIRLGGACWKIPGRVCIYAAGGMFEDEYERLRIDPAVEVHAVADSGHTIMLDQPDRLCEILVAGCNQNS